MEIYKLFGKVNVDVEKQTELGFISQCLNFKHFVLRGLLIPIKLEAFHFHKTLSLVFLKIFVKYQNPLTGVLLANGFIQKVTNSQKPRIKVSVSRTIFVITLVAINEIRAVSAKQWWRTKFRSVEKG